MNWARKVETLVSNPVDRNVWDLIGELIDRAAELEISDEYRLVTQHPIGKFERSTESPGLDEPAFVPALAIPLETKRNYECPSEHLDCLFEFIPKVTKLLVIGWRATETHFCQLLASKIPRDLKVLTVCGSEEGANEVNGRLGGVGLSGELLVARSSGFTDFVVNRESEEFLSS